MSFLKKYLFFTIFIAMVIALMLVAAFKLASSAKTFKGEKRELQGAIARLQQLHSRNPYPSAENVRKESENVDDLLQVYSSLTDLLRRDQVDEEVMEAPDFMPLLEKTLRSMRAKLDGARISVPANFAFGFDLYAGGQLPVSDDIPRLVQQLRIIELLCGVLADSGIADLSMITREVFETTDATPKTGRAGRRGATEAPTVITSADGAPEMPYSTQLFKLVFKTREHAFFSVLNRLASSPMFMAVTSASIASKGQDIKAQMVSRPVVRQEPGAPAVSLEDLPRDQRVILRKEDLEVTLEVEVYHFPTVMAFR